MSTVLIKPLVTEKLAALQGKSKTDTPLKWISKQTKPEIKAAVEAAYP